MNQTRTLEQANGWAYSRHGVTVSFPLGMAPILIGDAGSLITIEAPERFGSWSTRKERLTWMRQFTEGTPYP